MKGRNAVVAMTVGVALTMAGCGDESCPTEAAAVEGVSACRAPAPQQVSIDLELCETCAHTAPTCEPDLSALATGDIYLDTRWDVCPDDSSCSAEACAPVTCTFTVPEGPYTVHTLTPTGTTTFELTVSTSSASCSGTI